MTNTEIIAKTAAYVKETLADAEGGHDWFHIQRVWNTALRIAKDEEVDLLVVNLAALLHDIADAKFYNGDEAIGPKTAVALLNSLGVEKGTIEHVEQIIRNISFKNSLDRGQNEKFNSKELQVVRDADRLDAMGAIGVARAFNYGGYSNRELYNPEIPPQMDMDKAAYKKSKSPTINHFYEKLLLLKDQMHTETGKKMAADRHQFMENYLEQFFLEWNG